MVPLPRHSQMSPWALNLVQHHERRKKEKEKVPTASLSLNCTSHFFFLFVSLFASLLLCLLSVGFWVLFVFEL
jgi:hypothetical protein